MYKHFFKRFFDIICALILIVVLAPVMLLIAIAIKLNSKGPAIFKQIRSGKNNKKFKLYKFRSMTANNNFYDKTKEDQVTTVGKFLRKTSLDELPQLFNIIKGEMSFIGPRPWVVDYAEYFTPTQMRRLEVLPGITGLAQSSGRNAINILDRIALDVKYVDSISLMLDIKIIYKTIIGVIKKEGFSNSKSAIHDELKLLKLQHTEMYKEEFKQERTKKSTKNKSRNRKKENKKEVLVGSET